MYPFGWQEVSVDGTDVVYKDIIEPLESASVTISKTDKSSIADFGNPLEVTNLLLILFDIRQGHNSQVVKHSLELLIQQMSNTCQCMDGMNLPGH